MKTLFLKIGLLFLLISLANAQTDSLNISWDANSEPDIHRYKLQRSINSLNSFEDFLTLNHPLTHAVDHSVEPGSLYAYRVAAIDSAGNMSLYTAPVAVGIPEITWQLSSLNTGENTTIPRSSFLNDPDNDAAELQLEISQEDHVSVTVQNESIVLSPSPVSYSGPASFVMRAEDPDELFDVKTVSFEFIEGGSTVFIVEIPDITFDEDNDYPIALDSTVTHPNYPPEQISWSFMAGPDLNYSYNSSNRRVTIRSKIPNWNGSDRMIAVATAPDQSTAVDTFFVTIRPVNDPPQASIQSLFISPQSNNLFDLKLYADDVDNAPEELSWEFSGYSDFLIEWENEPEKIIKITPLNNAVSENGSFKVSDPAGASDTKQVTLNYVENNTPPHLTFPGEIILAEDSLIVLDLVNFVVDSTNTISELTWQFNTGSHLNAEYNPAEYKLRVWPDRDWFGESSLEFMVSDPFGSSDQQQIVVNVERRNDIENLAIQYQNSGEEFVTLRVEMPSTVEFTYWQDLSRIITVKLTNFQTRHLFSLGQVVSNTTYHFNLNIYDEAGGTIAIVDSVFYTGALANSPSGQELIVYPNPIKTNKGQQEMIFANLPAETRKIVLYSLVGERVYEEDVSQQSSPEYRINIVNNEADFPSGLYIYMIRDESSRILGSGKIVVIR